jgi:asparagine synthase (glutamine-hydrolysing)
VRTFLTPYLLAAQGDRVAMAHSVEGRFPFLDHRVVAFAGTIPARLRLRGLDEKHILKRAVRHLLPEEIWQRPKHPYRAPISAALCGPHVPEYVDALLAPAHVAAVGLFDPVAVARLRAKCRAGGHVGEIDQMALIGVLSTQLWFDTFIAHYDPAGCPERPDIVPVGAGDRPVTAALPP